MKTNRFGMEERPGDIKCARQFLHDVKTDGKQLLDAIQAEERLPTSSEEAELKAIEKEAEKAAILVARIESEMDVERSFHTVGSGYLPDEGAPRRANGSRQFNDLFAGHYIPNNGFSDLGEFLSVIHSGVHHPGLIQATSGMSEGVGSDGGFLVPSQFTSGLMDAAIEDEIVRPRADIQPMTSNTKVIAGFDTQNHSSNVAGFSGEWLDEGASASIDTGKVRKITLTARKLMIYTMASNEVIADGPGFESQLTSALVKGLSWYLDLAFISGTGAGEPRGFLNDDAVVEVAKESGQTADTITAINLHAMFARLHPASVKNSIWVASSTTIPQLLGLQNIILNQAGSENVGGAAIPVLRDDGSGAFSLLTRPVFFSEKCPVLGDAGDIALVDLSQYAVGLRPELSVQKSQHIGFRTDESAYRIVVRADGQGKWSSAVTPKLGSSLSWVVTLAARA